MTKAKVLASRFFRDERASVPVEYGMIAVLVSIVGVAVITSIGTRTNINFSGIIAGLQ
jgi:Flp pilus assembly pilin Flp